MKWVKIAWNGFIAGLNFKKNPSDIVKEFNELDNELNEVKE